MKINPDVKSIFDFKFEDFELIDYNPYPHIAAEVSVKTKSTHKEIWK